MKWAAIIFPGSNNDADSLAALRNALGADVEYVWHSETSLYGFDAIFIGGEATYGNYLRAGALAARSDITPALLKAAADGVPIIGAGNGFHFLTEIGLLPGGFKKNKNLKFVCKFTEIKIENNNTIFSNLYEHGESVRFPIANGAGNYHADETTLAELKSTNRIIFSYTDNPTGSAKNIAGIINENGNVLGILPQPERAVEEILGSNDGKKFFRSIK